MARFEIVEGQVWHCGMMVRRLRAEHRDATLQLGISAHHHLRRNFEDSSFRKAWLIDGALAGLGGVTGSSLSADGYIWLALSEAAVRYPVAVVREAKRQLSNLAMVKRDIVTTLMTEDRTALRFATKLGFELAHMHPVPFGNGTVIAVRYKGPSLARAA